MTITEEIKDTLKETCTTASTLFLIMIPISIVVKILSELGLITILGNYLQPAMGVVGLPGDFALILATAMITNIYGGLIVFFNLSLQNTYTVAQVTVLGAMILLAHNLPVEARIAQKAGVRIWFNLTFRIISAFILGWILSFVFTSFNLFQNKSNILWKPDVVDPSLTSWALGELRNYLMIFLIILGLMVLMKILKKTGVIEHLNNLLRPGLEFLGMSKHAAPIAIIGTTLGLAYGGGLIIKEAKSGKMSKKDVFYSISLMNLSHSLIEDTLLLLAIGASLFGILIGRVLFTILVIVLIIQIISRFSKKTFEKYFVSY
jgi:hypothetical protein